MKLQNSIENAEGYLEKVEEPAFRQIEFDWEGIHFQAKSLEKASGGGRIELKATLGSLYYTIENATNRAMAIERVYTTNRGIDGAYSISPKGDVSFQSITTTDQIMQGKELMSALTLILLESETHLRALHSHLKPHRIS